MPTETSQRPFTAAEDRQILDFRAQGLTFDALAEHLGRSCVSCRDRYNRLTRALNQRLINQPNGSGDAAKPKLQRACMCCRHLFWSIGSGNRLCAACKHRGGDEPYRLLIR
jgi:hypothetical protein